MNEQVSDKAGGAAPAESHYFALPAGSELFEFEIVSVLGHGGFGITYLATDTLLQEAVAIKEYFPSDLAVRVSDATVQAKVKTEQSDFKKGLSSFLEEARLMARFRHRSIVHVRRFFEHHGTGYIVQDYERGQTLSARLAGAPMTETDLRALLVGVLDGLAAVHERAILHRDLKPDNIILREDGTPVLIDFGAARDFSGRHSRSVTAIAAGGYTPPEQWGAGGQQGPWSDLYALGAIAYRCVTGAAPPVSLQRLRNDPLKPAVEAGKGKYGESLLATIDWMLTVDEAKRPASVAEVRETLTRESVAREPIAVDTGDGTIPDAKVLADETGGAQLAFGQPVSADVLELAFFVSPPRQYLTPSPGRKPAWGEEPHYFSLYRAGDEKQPVFMLEANVARHIPRDAEATITSRDGFIRATVKWPAAKTAARARPQWWKVVAGIVLAAAIGAGGYYLYTAYQAKREAERKLFLHELDTAGFDRSAIEAVLTACGSSCAADVKTKAKSQLDVIAAEDKAFSDARENLEALRAYVRDCKACSHKDEAAQLIPGLEEREAAERKRAAEEKAYTEARGDYSKILDYINKCVVCQFSETAREELATLREEVKRREADEFRAAFGELDKLKTHVADCKVCEHAAAARAQIASLEEDLRRRELDATERRTYMDARGNIDLLRGYVQSCSLCTHKYTAELEIRTLEHKAKYFDFQVCNHSGRRVSVAVIWRKNPDSSTITVSGWYGVAENECRVILQPARGIIYYMAVAYHRYTLGWRGNFKTCIPPGRAFERQIGDRPKGCRRSERLEGFFSKYVGSGDPSTYTWTLGR